MPRLLLLSHGYPPTERAGTEVYTERLADGLRARGWGVHVVAATRQPGRRQYECIESPGLTRIVQNMPFLGIAQGEQDPVIDRIILGVAARFRPDLVHIQHVMFLSAGVRFSVPVFWTLHDAWGWCSAGGTLLRPQGERCEGPELAACLGCARHRSQESALAAPAVRLAAGMSRVVDAEYLHRIYQSIPERWRARVPVVRQQVGERHIEARQRNLLALARHCRSLISPSQFLAERAKKAGFPVPRVVPHGVSPPPGLVRQRGEFFLFLGTLAPHKGPLLVREAHRAARVGLPLRIVGPPGPDLGYLARLRAGDPVPEPAVASVWPLLTRAKALVLGSFWAENAPLVVLEAQALGVPVIAPAVGGLLELVRGGWLYPVGDQDALAACLVQAEAQERVPDAPPTFDAHLDSLQMVYMT